MTTFIIFLFRCIETLTTAHAQHSPQPTNHRKQIEKKNSISPGNMFWAVKRKKGVVLELNLYPLIKQLH